MTVTDYEMTQMKDNNYLLSTLLVLISAFFDLGLSFVMFFFYKDQSVTEGFLHDFVKLML